MTLAPRLAHLSLHPGRPGVRRADSARARLLGLARLDRAAVPEGAALLVPRTRSVHTFGMRFALELTWLDAAESVVRVDPAVPPRRVRACRRARAVIERPAPGPGTNAGQDG